MSAPRKPTAKDDPAIEAAAAYVAAELLSRKADQALGECEAEAQKAYPPIPPMIQKPNRPRAVMTLFEAARASVGPDDFDHRVSRVRLRCSTHCVSGRGGGLDY